MVIAPPTASVYQKLNLAFSPVELEALQHVSSTRAERSLNTLTAALPLIFPENTPTVGVVELGGQAFLDIDIGPDAHFARANFVNSFTGWNGLRDDAIILAKVRNVFYGGVLLTGCLFSQGSSSLFSWGSLFKGASLAATSFLGYNLFKESGALAQARINKEHILNTVLLPAAPDVHAAFVAP